MECLVHRIVGKKVTYNQLWEEYVLGIVQLERRNQPRAKPTLVKTSKK